MGLLDFDPVAAIEKIEGARLVEFMAFVGEQTRRRPELELMAFKDVWHILLGQFGEDG